MNIFVLDKDTTICAKYHNDKHVVKMILETAQLLCGVHHATNSNLTIPYKLSHKNHPCSIWARESLDNYIWLCDLGIALSKEYTHRYSKIHKSQRVIEWCHSNLPKLPINGDISTFPLAMPDDCKEVDVIQSYRNYYMKYKKSFSKWSNRDIPHWFK